MNTNDIPVFVDLDRTLTRTDIAQEQLAAIVLQPGHLPGLLRATGQGRAQLKQFLAETAEFDPATLPYNQEVLDYLHSQRQMGRRIILATAADFRIAEQVAAHLDLFDDVIATRDGQNLKGADKLAAIRAHADGPFEYLGDSEADIPIWSDAARIGLINVPDQTRERISQDRHVSLRVDNAPPAYRAALKAMRPHQWVKNALIFLPLFFSHGYADPALVARAFLAFVAFSLLASSVYLVNDILDLQADRVHQDKRNRPFASGTLSPLAGLGMAAGLATFAFGLSAITLGFAITVLLLVYLLVTTLYSTWFKHYSTIDVIVLTCLYTMRIFVGGVAIGALPSPWLLNFSLFFFVSLALMKRHVELVSVRNQGGDRSRGYYVGDLPAILAAGIANGGLAVLTLTLYLNSDFVKDTYASPLLLWLVAPLILFWIQRAWIWTLRDKIHSDPVVFALKDSISRKTLYLTCAIVIAAKYLSIGDWFQ